MSKKIYVTEKQKHFLLSLPELFSQSSLAEITAIANTLGLANLIEDGKIVPMYSVQINSSSDRFLEPDTVGDISLSCNFYNYFSIEDADSYEWMRISGDDSDNNWFKTGKNIVISKLDLTDKIYSNDVEFKVFVKKGENTYTDTISFSTIVSLSKIQIEASSHIFVGNSPTHINFTTKLSNILPIEYRWYVNGVFVHTGSSYKLNNPNTEVTKVSVEVIDSKGITHTDFIDIPKVKNGDAGEPGVPGLPGVSGQTFYTHIKYADDSLGTNMSEYPYGSDGSTKPFIGISENNLSPVESDDPNDYKWSSFVGPQGIPGKNGFLWIKYSEYSEGRDEQGNVSMRDDTYDPVKEEYMVYMGIAYNKQNQNESNIPEDYIWSKIKGDDGHTGYVLDLSNENQQIPTDSDGNLAGEQSLIGAETSITLYYGNTPLASNRWSVDAVASDSGLTYRIDTLTTHRQLIVTGYDTDNMIDYIDISVRLSGNVIKQARFTLTKSINAATYSLIPSVSSIKVSSDGIISPNKLSFKVLKNTGISIVETSEATVTYKYDFNTGDGTPIPNGTELSLSNSGNPNSIQLMLYHPETNILVDREDIPFVRDGSKGDKGDQGIQGAQGSPGIDGAIPLTHEWVSGTTYYNGQARKDYVYYRVTNTWYKIKDGVTSAVAGASPDGNWVVALEMKNVVLGEMLNVGGWIISNNKLFSQAGLVTDGNGKPLYSNIVLDGISSSITFQNNRAYLNQNGFILKDNNSVTRMAMVFDDGAGVPILRQYNPDGSIKWEAGQEGYRLIVTGTQQPTWSNGTGFRWINTLTNDENLDFGTSILNSNRQAAKQFISNFVTGESNSSNLGTMLQSNQSAYFVLSAFPNYNDYSVNNNIGIGKVYRLNKGDIASNANLVEAYYKTKTYATSVPNTNLLPDGWYIHEGLSGANGGMLMATPLSQESNSEDYYTTIGYFKDGNIKRVVEILIHTRTNFN